MSQGETYGLEETAKQRFKTLMEAETRLLQALFSGELANYRSKTTTAVSD